jgi:transposase
MSARKLPEDAFDFYHALGAGRSYRAVAKHYGCSKTAVANAARREDWESRIAERERKTRERVEEKTIETLADIRTRHLKMVRTIEAKALEGLRQLRLETGMECVRALDLALKAERVILGEPLNQAGDDIREIVRRETRMWLKPVDDEF